MIRRQSSRSSGLRRLLVVVLVAATSTLSCSVDAAVGTDAAAAVAEDVTGSVVDEWAPTYPRTATYYLDQDRLPPVAELARYDLVVIDHEWAHRVPHSYFGELEAANPRMKLFAYVNLVDFPDSLGSPEYWEGRYDLWQFSSSSDSTFPEEWLATTASGEPVSEWPDTTMVNLTDAAPQVDGVTYPEYAADWVVDRVWSAGIWDGILLDVWGDRIYSADTDRWDIDGDGDDESDSRIYGSAGPWARGVAQAEQIMRDRLPADAMLIANGDRTLEGDALDGRAWESFADLYADRDPRLDIDQYLATTAGAGHRPPGVWMTIDRRRLGTTDTEQHQRARFFATATLLADGFWAPMGLEYGTTDYYDELDGGGLGRGYLGRPVPEDSMPGTLGRGVDGLPAESALYRRDFENGIVLVNAGATTERVTLERPYQRLRGREDPVTNNGEIVDEVVLAPRDGIVLVRPHA